MNSSQYFRDKWPLGLLVVGLACLSACSPNASKKEPVALIDLGVKLEGQWHATLQSKDHKSRLSSTPWLKELQLPALTAAVHHGLTHNPSLQASIKQMQAVEAKARLARSKRGPDITLSGQASRQRTNTSTATPTPVYSESYRTQGQLNWELDLWGRLRDNHRAAVYDLKVQQAILDGARLSLIGRISQAWLDATAQQQLDTLAQQRLTIEKRLLAEAEQAYRSGQSPASTVQRQRATLSRAQADASQQREQRNQSQRLLQRLLGNYPTVMKGATLTWPKTAAPISAGVPAAVLEQRWDVGQAGLAWYAAKARVNAAKKSRLPSISLAGSIGTSSTDAGDLLDPDYLIWSILGNLSAPVWKSGAILAEIKQADAQAGAALASFRDVVLTALLEVENHLSQDTALRQQIAQLTTALTQRQRAAQTLSEEYRQGVVDYDAYQAGALALLDAREQVIRRQSAFWTNRINLYLALGGPAVATDNTIHTKPNSSSSKTSSHD